MGPNNPYLYRKNGATGWTGANGNNTADIVIANHSNADVYVDAAFGTATTATTSGVTATLSGDIANFKLNNAAVVAYGNSDAAEKANVLVTLTGVPTKTVAGDTFTVGTVKVTISKDAQ